MRYFFQFIADYVESLCASSECQQLVMEALKWHLMPERRAQISSDRTRPRKSTVGRLLAIGGVDAHRGSVSIESFCPRLNKWTMLKHLTTGRRLQFGVALVSFEQKKSNDIVFTKAKKKKYKRNYSISDG